jgi:hypothetical protein
MPLALVRNFEAPQDAFDYYMVSGQLRVGRIYKRPITGELQFLWALNGVFSGPHDMRVAGMVSTFDQAQSALQENWEKWLAWARLQEGRDSAPQAAGEPPRVSASYSEVV